MTKKLIINLLFLLFLATSACQNTDNTDVASTQAKNTSNTSPRIISLSGFLTEVLHNLGHSDKIVGRDVTSTYPEELSEVPNLGHITQLNIEAVLQLKPSLIFVEQSQLRQAQSLKSLDNAGIQLVVVPTSHELNNALNAAKAIAEHLKTESSSIDELAEELSRDSLQLVNTLSKYSDKPKVLFIYARGAGNLMVGGNNTAAAAMIEKSGGINAMQSFDNFQALTPEALVEAAPDVILMFTTGLSSLDGKEGLKQIPGIAQTPAFENNRIVAMDGHYLTAFGPRVGKAAIELAQKIHEI